MIIDRPTTKDIPALRRLWQQAFGDSDAFLDGFFATGFAPERCRCVYLEDNLAAALYWFDCHWQGKKAAYLYAVATEASLQGRGLCRALMEDTHRYLQSAGYAGAALVPGSRELFSLYDKLGYRGFCPMQTLTVAAGETPLPLQELKGDSFLKERRCRLPENALVQEGETIAFLSTFCRFYKAEDALLAISREDNTLHFQECLGDPELLGGIITALGGKQGIVRLSGGSENTAMYLSFTSDPALPSYLGIPLN